MLTINVRGRAGDTFSETSTNTAQDLDTGTVMSFKDSDDRLITSLYLQVQSNDLSFCFGATPVQGGLGILLTVGQTLYIENPANIRGFKYISNVADAHATLVITPFYGNY